MDTPEHFLATLAIVLCTAGVTTVLFQRLRQPVVLGYLLAGMLVGPYVPVPVEADTDTVRTLSELGVILLMFSLGIEFSFAKLARVGLTAGVIAIVQCSGMVWLGFLAGQAFGWSWLQSLFAGGVIAISSTTIIIKAFAEQGVEGRYKSIVLGVLIVEDLIAILLITILTTLAQGQDLTAWRLAAVAGRLTLFLLVLVVVGMLTVPRLMRLVVGLNRPETTVVTSVGLAFFFALLALRFGYSVALGAFIAGSLVAESGVHKTIEDLVLPVRDIFAAIFFVSVGMLIDPATIAEHWRAVTAFFVVVVMGKVVLVTFAALLTGQNIRTAVQSGMSLAQIGEFSFIIAGIGQATGATDKVLYPVAVAVSAATTLITPWLIRAADPVATFVDRKLPQPVQTFLTLYGSWLEQVANRPAAGGEKQRVRRLGRWLIADALMATAVIVVASLKLGPLTDLTEQYLGLPAPIARLVVIAGAAGLSAPFWMGIIRVTRFLGAALAARAFPPADGGQVDLAAAPRRLLVVSLQLLAVVLVAAPIVAITQPFLPALQMAVMLSLGATLLVLSFWRNAANLQGHTRAAAQAIAESMARQSREEPSGGNNKGKGLDQMFVGLGSPVSIELAPDSSAVGKSLIAVNLRSLTGATILAIRRGDHSIVVPSGREVLQARDVLALAGSREAIAAARELLSHKSIA